MTFGEFIVSVKLFDFPFQVLSASLWGGLLLPIGDKPTSIADRYRNTAGHPITIITRPEVRHHGSPSDKTELF